MPLKVTLWAAALFVGGCTLTFTPQQQVESPPPDAGIAPTANMAIVAEADVPVAVVDEYYFVGGRYYYWHPGVNRYVLLRGSPPPGRRISEMDHLARRDRAGRPLEHPVVRPHAPQPPNTPMKQKKDDKKKSNQ